MKQKADQPDASELSSAPRQIGTRLDRMRSDDCSSDVFILYTLTMVTTEPGSSGIIFRDSFSMQFEAVIRYG